MQYDAKIVESAKKLRLIDDALFRLVGARIDACQEILRTLLDDENLVVIQAIPQERITSIYREITLDVLCRTGKGKLVNIEVQKGNQNDDIKRCRFHLSSITANKTPKGTAFEDIPDVVVLYITEYDALNNGQSITCSEMCQKQNDKYIPVNDGAKVYYANTVVKDNTDKSELLSLFLEKNAFDNNKFPNLSKAMKYFKDSEEGVSEVCQVVQEYAKEYADKQAKTFAIYLINDGKSTEEIASVTHLSVTEIDELRQA